MALFTGINSLTGRGRSEEGDNLNHVNVHKWSRKSTAAGGGRRNWEDYGRLHSKLMTGIDLCSLPLCSNKSFGRIPSSSSGDKNLQSNFCSNSGGFNLSHLALMIGHYRVGLREGGRANYVCECIYWAFIIYDIYHRGPLFSRARFSNPSTKRKPINTWISRQI